MRCSTALVAALLVWSVAAFAQSPPPESPDPSETAPPAPAAFLKPLPPPAVKAASAILIDAVSGQVLYERKADTRRPMASTTKIMTALLFCESAPETAVITASKRASETPESSLHLKPGEKISARDLLKAILMRSANDGCVAAAEHVAGSEAAFAAKMNERAAQLGATNTHFTNSHGLHSPAHYTTARDLAIIARAALQEPRINAVIGTKRAIISRSSGSRDVTLRNHSRFLGKFPGADGVKTGWTIPAGRCYVGSATWNGWRLLSVVLKSPDYVSETAALMKYGFYHFEPHLIAAPGSIVGQCPVQAGAQPSVPVTVQNRVQVVTRKGDTTPVDTNLQFQSVSAPLTVGATVGVLEARHGDKTLCTCPLVTVEAAAPAPTTLSVGVPSGWRGFALTTSVLVVSLVSLRYGTRYGIRLGAAAQNARRRRRRFASLLRDAYRRR